MKINGKDATNGTLVLQAGQTATIDLPNGTVLDVEFDPSAAEVIAPAFTPSPDALKVVVGGTATSGGNTLAIGLNGPYNANFAVYGPTGPGGRDDRVVHYTIYPSI